MAHQGYHQFLTIARKKSWIKVSEATEVHNNRSNQSRPELTSETKSESDIYYSNRTPLSRTVSSPGVPSLKTQGSYQNPRRASEQIGGLHNRQYPSPNNEYRARDFNEIPRQQWPIANSEANPTRSEQYDRKQHLRENSNMPGYNDRLMDRPSESVQMSSTSRGQSDNSQPILRTTRFGYREHATAEQDPRTRYAADENASSLTGDFKWEVKVRWDDPESNLPSSFDDTQICIIKFDSGCERSNWVKESIFWRLRASIRPSAGAAEFVAFNGQHMRTIGMTSLTFQDTSGGMPFRAEFWVACGEDIPFDMVLGATDSVKFGILDLPKSPRGASAVWGLAAYKMSKADLEEQEKLNAEHAKAREEQRRKHESLRIPIAEPSNTQIEKSQRRNTVQYMDAKEM